MRPRTIAAAIAAAGALALAGPGHTQPLLDFEPQEIRRILQHGPWPPAAARDPSNRASGDARAVALGQRLFFDPRLSVNGAIACATCHVPERAWTDGRPRAVGLDRLDRNTPTVLDAGLHRWFSWDGRSDSLWSQSVKPILDPREMGASARHVVTAIAAEPVLACLYREVYGPPADDERVLVNVGKALAAFVETLRSGRTPFDEFRDALARGDRTAAARYPLAAQRGLKIFVGSGNCSLCHVGPQFTNGEFHDVGVPFFVALGRVDAGRHDGIKRLRADRFNLLGPYSDDATGTSAIKTRHVEPQHANFGQFKTPALRNVAVTAPYMHDGRYATLPEVVRHYSTLNMDRLHTHGEQLLRPLGLSPGAADDLVAFLESLTDPRATAGPPPLAAAGPCPASRAGVP
jgi:cytochrome c peroxidase